MTAVMLIRLSWLNGISHKRRFKFPLKNTYVATQCVRAGVIRLYSHKNGMGRLLQIPSVNSSLLQG